MGLRAVLLFLAQVALFSVCEASHRPHRMHVRVRRQQVVGSSIVALGGSIAPTATAAPSSTGTGIGAIATGAPSILTTSSTTAQAASTTSTLTGSAGGFAVLGLESQTVITTTFATGVAVQTGFSIATGTGVGVGSGDESDSTIVLECQGNECQIVQDFGNDANGGVSETFGSNNDDGSDNGQDGAEDDGDDSDDDCNVQEATATTVTVFVNPSDLQTVAVATEINVQPIQTGEAVTQTGEFVTQTGEFVTQTGEFVTATGGLVGTATGEFVTATGGLVGAVPTGEVLTIINNGHRLLRVKRWA